MAIWRIRQLESRVITHLYRIAQEAVTNAVKHAQADAIRIDLKSSRGFTRLRVTDNGVGIPGNGHTARRPRVAGHAAPGGIHPREPVDSSQSVGRNDRRLHAAAAACPSALSLTADELSTLQGRPRQAATVPKGRRAGER